MPNLVPPSSSLLDETTPMFSEDSTPNAKPVSSGDTFRPGQLVAGRYRVVRFLAQGGMGEVYEAEDQELNEAVALKIVRPEIAEDVRMMDRFLHEIRLARRVTHPNVCRIFDVFHHQTSTGGDVAFLTMELLRGETLSTRLRRGGRMGLDEALPLVRQMGGALGAAHDVGVVHLDFKSQNVMLVPSERGPRAIVMDFGLARAAVLDEDSAASASKVFAGTPATMAPEQVEGGPITPAADIYAFGVVLYQIVTGRLPFSGSTPATMAVKRLTEPPPAPRTHIPDLDPEWELVILRCLERNPAKRYSNMLDILEALGANTNGSSQRALAERLEQEHKLRQRRRRKRLVLASLPAFLVLSFVGFQQLYAPSKLQGAAMQGLPSSETGRKIRRSIAILGFKNLSGQADTQWLSMALSEMFGSELAAGELMRVLPGEDVTRMKLELALTDASGFSKDTLQRIQKNLGTDLVMLGSYLALDSGNTNKVRLDLLVQDAATGETLASLTEAGTVDQLHDLISRTGGRLRGALPVGELTSEAIAGVRASLPSNPEAIRLYALGLEKLHSFEALVAKELLQQAITADPQHALSHWALGEAWKRLGHDEKAIQAAQKAFELSQDLSREERLSVEASYREVTRDWDRAIEIYRSLLTFFPDNLEYGLRLVEALTLAERGPEALTTIEKLRQLFPGAIDDPRLDLAEALAAESLTDMDRQLKAAEQAIAKGTKRETPLLVARAKLLAWQPQEFFGDNKAAQALCEDVRRICTNAHDQMCVARAMEGLGLLLAREGGPQDEALQKLQSAVEISRTIGDQRGMARTLRTLGQVQRDWGDTAKSRQFYDEALEISRSIGDRQGAATALGQIGVILHRQGRLDEAKETYEQALAQHRSLGYRRGIHQTLRGVAGVLALQGRVRDAQAKLEELTAFNRQSGHLRDVADTASYLGGLLWDQGKLSQAQAVYEEGLQLFTQLDDRGGQGRMHYNLANTLARKGQLAEAAAHYGKALEIFGSLKDRYREESVRFYLAKVLLDQGQIATALAQLENAAKALRTQGDLEELSLVQYALGDAKFRAGDLQGARSTLLQALDLQQQQSNTVPAAETRLALARVDLESGSVDQALQGVQDALQQFGEDGSVDHLLLSQAVIAEAYLAKNDRTAALAALDSVQAQFATSENLAVRLHFATVQARVKATSGQLPDVQTAFQALESIRKDAEEVGLASESLQARLAVGALELVNGQVLDGRARLEALRAEAASRGFGLVASKTAALLD